MSKGLAPKANYHWDGTNWAKNTPPATEAKQDDIISALSDKKAVRTAEDSGDSNIQYIGLASVGSLTSAEVWQIMKVDETSGTVITFADGDDSYDNEWDERESLTYS